MSLNPRFVIFWMGFKHISTPRFKSDASSRIPVRKTKFVIKIEQKCTNIEDINEYIDFKLLDFFYVYALYGYNIRKLDQTLSVTYI